MKQIILASKSPRRKELLEMLGLKFNVVASNFDEDIQPDKDLTEFAKKIAKGKAEAVALKYKNHIIISADTFVILDGKILGKPKDKAEAFLMLNQVKGKKVEVVTAFTILDSSSSKSITKAIVANVYLNNYSKEEIEAYIKTGEPLDKAGAFAVQGLGSVLVKRIEGDFYSVIGLPLFEFSESLKEFRVSVL